MNRRRLQQSAAAAAMAALLLAGCEPAGEPAGRAGEENGTLERLGKEMDEAIDKAEDVAREQGNRFIESAEMRLREMREDLADARRREEFAEEARGRFNAAAEQLEEDIKDLEGELRRLRAAGAEAWRDSAPRIREAMEDLSASFERFRETYLRPRQTPEQPR